MSAYDAWRGVWANLARCWQQLGLGDRGMGILATDLNYRRALNRQTFPVSGVAQIDDPIFR
jgi:hypothetical protein